MCARNFACINTIQKLVNTSPFEVYEQGVCYIPLQLNPPLNFINTTACGNAVNGFGEIVCDDCISTACLSANGVSNSREQFSQICVFSH
jgi:hypothetical protein